MPETLERGEERRRAESVAVARRTTVLLIEDSPADADMITGLLTLAASFRAVLTHVTSLGQGLKRLARGGVDVVLLDLHLPDSAGFPTVARVRQAAPDVPVIVLTGIDENEIAVQAVHEGAQDYLPKASVDGRLLERTIRYAVERQGLAAELKRKYAKEHELNQLKSQLVSMVSHEFANALTVIECALPLLAESSDTVAPEKRQSFYKSIDSNVASLDALVHHLMHMGRLEDGRFKLDRRPTEIGPLLEKVLAGLEMPSRQKELRTSLSLPHRPLVVSADPETLSLVISNLVGNAIKYTPAQGKITVGARVNPARRDRAILFVQDSGIGISRADQEKIFVPFFRTGAGRRTAKGFGVGLAFVKAVVEAHGGTIKVVSAPRRGSCFSLILPIHA